MAPLRQAQHPRQHHPDAAAAQVARTQPSRKRLAVHPRQLALQPRLPLLRRHPRPLLLRLEHARRPALDHHVDRSARLGPSVLISGIWYKIINTCKQESIDINNIFIMRNIMTAALPRRDGTSHRWLVRRAVRVTMSRHIARGGKNER